MKTKIIATLAFTALIFSACNKNEAPAVDDNQLRLSTVATRATSDNQIVAAQQVGLFIAEDAATPTVTYTQNLTATADGSGGLTITPSQYYPNTGNGVTISAYHPYNAASGAYDFTVAANQTADADYNAGDLLYSPTKTYAKQAAVHTMTLDHKLSKITCTLISGAGVPDITGAKVTILGLLPTANFNPQTGAVGTAKGTAVNITPNATGAVVVPQSVAAGDNLIEVELASGGKLYYKVPAGGANFTAGNVYNYTITVNLTDIQIKTNVSLWTPIGIAGNAEMD